MEAVKIHPPEGYEVCPTSTQTEIRFRPVSKSKPKWEDFGRIKGFWIRSDTSIGEVDLSVTDDSSRNTWPTKEEAEACLALSQLCQWRDKYNENWKPDWEHSEFKFHIVVGAGKVISSTSPYNSHVLTFKTAKIRDKFLEDFSELIEIAKPLL